MHLRVARTAADARVKSAVALESFEQKQQALIFGGVGE